MPPRGGRPPAAAQATSARPAPQVARPFLHCTVPALAVAAVGLLPFLGKAFTIDDTLFLRQAQQILVDPLHPTAFEMVWSEAPEPQRMSAIMPSGPVMAYLLTPCVRFGGAEWVAHLTVFLLFGLGIAATARLALRLGADGTGARAAALLLAATPAALGMAGTAMPDVPAMAFGVIGVEQALAWRDERRWHQSLLAVLALTLAILARSHMALLLGVVALALPRDAFSWTRWKATSASTCAPVLAVPILVSAVLVLTRDPAATTVALAGAASTFSSSANIGRNAVAFSVHWCLALPLALPWAVLRWRTMQTQVVPYAAAAGAGVLLYGLGETTWLILLAPAAGLGAGALWDILADAWRRRDSTQAVLGLWLLIGLPVAIYLHMPSKYLLASAPAAAVLVGRALAARTRTVGATVLAVSVVAGLGLGMLVLRADAALADLGRRAATELIAPQVSAGRRVWFAGHWGFQWYAERAGARPLTRTPPFPYRGDLAVSSLLSGGHVLDMFPQRTPLSGVEDVTPGGRIMSRSAGAGFYSNAWGYLPWAWGEGPVDAFVLWRLE